MLDAAEVEARPRQRVERLLLASGIAALFTGAVVLFAILNPPVQLGEEPLGEHCSLDGMTEACESVLPEFVRTLPPIEEEAAFFAEWRALRAIHDGDIQMDWRSEHALPTELNEAWLGWRTSTEHRVDSGNALLFLLDDEQIQKGPFRRWHIEQAVGGPKGAEAQNLLAEIDQLQEAEVRAARERRELAVQSRWAFETPEFLAEWKAALLQQELTLVAYFTLFVLGLAGVLVGLSGALVASRLQPLRIRATQHWLALGDQRILLQDISEVAKSNTRVLATTTEGDPIELPRGYRLTGKQWMTITDALQQGVTAASQAEEDPKSRRALAALQGDRAGPE